MNSNNTNIISTNGCLLGQTRSPASPMHYKDFKDVLEVDLSCPSGLRWLDTENVPSKGRGKPAGSLKKASGYYKVKVNGRNYQAHRVVFCLAHQVPSMDTQLVIDHIDGDRGNNSIENLRLVTSIENNRNKRNSLQGLKASPFPYVNWNAKAGKWQARLPAILSDEGKQHYIGCFETAEIAYMVLMVHGMAQTLPITPSMWKAVNLLQHEDECIGKAA